MMAGEDRLLAASERRRQGRRREGRRGGGERGEEERREGEGERCRWLPGGVFNRQ